MRGGARVWGRCGALQGAPGGWMVAGPLAAAWLLWTTRTGRGMEGSGRTGRLDRIVPRWLRRGAYVAATWAGERKETPDLGMDGGRRRPSLEAKRDDFGGGEYTGSMARTEGS